MSGATTLWLNGLGQALAIGGVVQTPKSQLWNFVSGVTAAYNTATGAWDLTVSGGSGSAHVIEDEGIPLTQRSHLNFVGVNVVVTDAGGKTVVTIGAVDLTSGVTGTLPYTRGGTGLGTLGTALQSFRVNAGATAIEWYTPAAGLAAPASPGDNGKVATASAGNLSYILIGTAQISASAGIVLTQVANGTALSVVGVAGNAGAAYADITAGVDGYVLRRSGTGIGFGTIATAGITDAAITLAKIQNASAQGKFLLRKSASAGPFEEGVFHDGIETDATGGKLSDTIPARGTKNTAVDLVPSGQAGTTIATASAATMDIAITSGKWAIVTFAVRCHASNVVKYVKTLQVYAQNVAGTVAIDSQSTLNELLLEGAVWTLVATASGGNVRATLTNSSGSTRTYSWIGGKIEADL